MNLMKRILNSFVFWGAWIIIPVLMEILPSLGSIFLLLKRRIQGISAAPKPIVYPEISLIIPVYNSADTLYACISSVFQSTYPADHIRIFLVNNQSSDNSFEVFAQCQEHFPELKMQWLDAEQGKSRAMNLALYNSEGKYIINLDSDGILDPSALANMVNKFEAHTDLNCMTGAILTRPDKILAYRRPFSRLLRQLEFVEYAQAFLAGRSYASELNAVYTLSGAFSAFRKSAVLKSWMYNTDTVCEDTHITFQMRCRQKERVEVCENAIFYVDPIESVNKLYTQRQRWQRGSLEVAQMFMDKNFKLRHVFRDVNVKTLLYDHTFAFPRMIWYLALICMMCMNYSTQVILYSSGLIFALYIAIGVFYFISVAAFLKMEPRLRWFYLSLWWCVPILPFFNLAVFFIRVAGVINSIQTDSTWRSRDLTEERSALDEVIQQDARRVRGVLQRADGWMNRKPRAAVKAAKPSQGIYSFGWYFWVGLLLLAGGLITYAAYWSKKTFGVAIDALLDTLLGPLQGAGGGMVQEVIHGLVVPAAIALGAYILLCLADWVFGRWLKRRWRNRSFGLYRLLHRGVALLGAFSLFFSAAYANERYGLLEYYTAQGTQSAIYTDYFAAPQDTVITAPEHPKNLIYIYVESLETTYASQEDGGVQEVNYMPRLSALAQENLNFADVDNMGGWHAVTGTTWTMAALISTTSGIHYSSMQETDFFDENVKLYPNLVTLGDILAEHGYRQEFLCGSDGSFAGRKQYFKTHGGYEVMDLLAAEEAGYVSSGGGSGKWEINGNWGIEDKILFEIAKEELSELAAGSEPFNLTILTVDLHAPHGYLCEWCGDQYPETTANVVECNDRYICEFIEWCQKQDFYEDTVIIITGDHPRMDNDLVDGVAYYDRTVYDCFINVDTPCAADPKTRTFTSLDMFPTTLAAMGFSIEGDRLGLGTNLFSAKQTVAEEKGCDWLDHEYAKQMPTDLF